MWRHCLWDEYACSQHLETATAAADLSKFYERIRHDLLVEEGSQSRYPLRLLRLNISAYRGVRRCSYRRALGRPVRARRSVGAGCSHAHGVIKLFLLRAIINVSTVSRGVRIRVVVDDVSGQAHGPCRAVARRTLKFITLLGQELEGRLGLKINRDKTVVVVGSKQLADVLRPRLQALGGAPRENP